LLKFTSETVLLSSTCIRDRYFLNQNALLQLIFSVYLWTWKPNMKTDAQCNHAMKRGERNMITVKLATWWCVKEHETENSVESCHRLNMIALWT